MSITADLSFIVGRWFPLQQMIQRRGKIKQMRRKIAYGRQKCSLTNGISIPPMNGHLVGVQMMKHNMFLKNSPSTARKRGLSRSFKNMMGESPEKRYSSTTVVAWHLKHSLEFPVPNKKYSVLKTALSSLHKEIMDPTAVECKLGWQKTMFEENGTRPAIFETKSSSNSSSGPLPSWKSTPPTVPYVTQLEFLTHWGCIKRLTGEVHRLCWWLSLSSCWKRSGLGACPSLKWTLK